MHKLKRTEENVIKMTVLPTDAGQALKVMIQISERLLDITDRETQALVRNDAVAFSILQNEKEAQSGKYAKASEEFRSRLEEFRNVDKTLLNRLEKLQNDLGEKTKSNREIITHIFTEPKRKSKESLLTVQELGQRNQVTFSNRDGSAATTGA